MHVLTPLEPLKLEIRCGDVRSTWSVLLPVNTLLDHALQSEGAYLTPRHGEPFPVFRRRQPPY